jgi:hypothetical protein
MIEHHAIGAGVDKRFGDYRTNARSWNFGAHRLRKYKQPRISLLDEIDQSHRHGQYSCTGYSAAAASAERANARSSALRIRFLGPISKNGAVRVGTSGDLKVARLDEWAAQSGISHHGPRRCLSAKEHTSDSYGMHSVEILGEDIHKPVHDRDARVVN